LRGRRRAKLRPWSARTMQRRCNECRAAPWKVSFPRWWVRVPSHRRPRRLADGMEGQLATHTAGWNALFPPLAAYRGAAKPKEEGVCPTRPPCQILPPYLQVAIGHAHAKGWETNSTEYRPCRSGTDGTGGTDGRLSRFLGHVGAFADPVMRAGCGWLQKAPKTFRLGLGRGKSGRLTF
jgi:hypothetical protein